jgi:hypothetical protein
MWSRICDLTLKNYIRSVGATPVFRCKHNHRSKHPPIRFRGSYEQWWCVKDVRVLKHLPFPIHHTKKLSSIKSQERGGQVTDHPLTIHFHENFRFTNSRTTMWKLEGVPSCWNSMSFEPCSPKVSKRNSSNMFIYSTSFTGHSGGGRICFNTAQNILNFGVSLVVTSSVSFKTQNDFKEFCEISTVSYLIVGQPVFVNFLGLKQKSR